MELGGFTLGDVIGEGAMGKVHRATRYDSPGRFFAVKVLGDNTDLTPKVLARFEREMSALVRATNHPNVVQVLASSAAPPRPWIAMELVQGDSLDALTRHEPLEPRRAAQLMRDVCDAVAFVHGAGIVHRDLKPANILVEPGDRARVCDFGLALVADSERLTNSGMILGTVAYIAPEQLRGGAHHVDARADVYALGACLYHALTGRPPFQEKGQAAVIRRALSEPPIPPSHLEPAVPVALDAVVLKALAKLADDRYPTAAELRDDLARWLATGKTLAATAPKSVPSPNTAAPAKTGCLGMLLALLGQCREK